jgi:hypothetical protein
MRRLLAFSGLLAVLVFLPVCTPAGSPPESSASSYAGQKKEKGNPSVKVWVNTASGVYHCPWYALVRRNQGR